MIKALFGYKQVTKFPNLHLACKYRDYNINNSKY